MALVRDTDRNIRRIGQDGGNATRGLRRVDRQERATGLERGQQGNDEVLRPIQDDGNNCLRNHPHGLQPTSQRLRAPVELCVGELAVLVRHRDGGRIASSRFRD